MATISTHIGVGKVTDGLDSTLGAAAASTTGGASSLGGSSWKKTNVSKKLSNFVQWCLNKFVSVPNIKQKI